MRTALGRWIPAVGVALAALIVAAWLISKQAETPAPAVAASDRTASRDATLTADREGPLPKAGFQRPPDYANSANVAPPDPAADDAKDDAGDDHEPPPDERASGFLGIYNKWNPGWVRANMRDTANPDALEELLDWFRNELGECDEPAPMLEATGQYSRYAYPCEKGTLEVGFVVEDEDPRRLKTVQLGARDVEPADEVRQAAEQALTLLRAWDPRLFHTIFNSDFEEDETRNYFDDARLARGSCQLEGVDLGNARGALWFIACEKGPALMKTDLDDEDKIRIFFIEDRRAERLVP